MVVLNPTIWLIWFSIRFNRAVREAFVAALASASSASTKSVSSVVAKSAVLKILRTLNKDRVRIFEFEIF